MLPWLPAAIARTVRERGGASSVKYGDDMVMLRDHLAPMLNSRNTVHHAAPRSSHVILAEVPERPPSFVCGLTPRPFPATAYRGFVGQPINCLRCDALLFSTTGCQHIAASRTVPAELASRLRCNPDVMLSLSAFL
jgi:hypothetical protein